MAKETILRIQRSDSPGDFILVKVARSGSSELDLKLVATEGEAPYRANATVVVKSTQIDKLRAKNYHGTDDEWAGILAYALGQKQSASSVPEAHKSGLEVAATVKQDEDDASEKEIVISLRKRIDTITQRLGTISLKQDDDQAIELFEWTGATVTRANELEDELASLSVKYDTVESTISKLTLQLEELIKAKAEHDDQLIAKFAQLLNEKKLKIRNQHRLLASANIDPAKELSLVDELNASPETGSTRPRGKRKAEEPAVSSESEDGFDTMDVDKVGNKGNASRENEDQGEGDEDIPTESERQETPDPLEDETATEDEADEPAEAPHPPPTARDGNRKQRTLSKQPTASTSTKKTTSSPPPRRELPFTRRRGPVNPPPADEGDSDEDDEL
ncbi:hypothetical protein ACJ72_05977 [Emergomyces africanus]|uniref:Uncharacterized protein n=1 Tax=Emergomyces africanus TaxID=1955775 RepID=A0A1B7NSH7_9EURO|nr:hypothetical protein ACJ72_05977 [Emergomyces africanus]